MKNLFLPLATTTLLLLFLLLTTTANADTVVYDVMGEPLLSTKTYYMVPYDYSDVGGGGLKWQQKSVGTCTPYYVAQEDVNTNFGKPIAFFPQTTGQTVITLSSLLNIEFTNFLPPSCPAPGISKVWSAVADSATGIEFIQLQGTKGSTDVRSWFTIEEVDVGGYKIRYCPRNRRAACGDLGIVPVKDGGRWLGVNGTHPLTFVFENEPFFVKNARRSVPAYKLGTSYVARVLSLFN